MLERGLLRVEVTPWPFAFTIRRRGRRLLRAGGAWLADGESRDHFLHFTEGVLVREERSPAQRAVHGSTSSSSLTCGRRRSRRPGVPIIRPLCLLDPADPRGWTLTDAYGFGPSMWIAPVLEDGMREREVSLPRGDWIEAWSGRRVCGGGEVVVASPLELIPVWVRDGSIVVSYPPEDVARGLGERPEQDRRLVATLWGAPTCGRAGARLADGDRIGWYEGEWELPAGRAVTTVHREAVADAG